MRGLGSRAEDLVMTFDPWRVAQNPRSPHHLGGKGLVSACALDSFSSWRVLLVALSLWHTYSCFLKLGHCTPCHCVRIALCVAFAEVEAG